jgi:hypothetical protein
MTEKIRLPVRIEVLPYLREHTFEGKAVFPAVEALQCLAASTKKEVPEINVRIMNRASFPRFLHLGVENSFIEAFNEIEVMDNGEINANLITMALSKSGNISRPTVHARVSFAQDGDDQPVNTARMSFDLGRDVFEVPVERLYQELVPLGTAYQNARPPVRINKKGAIACLQAPELPAQLDPLGSPFPLDAAMHCACVWSQRFANVVAFPIGFERRIIHHRTRPGEDYLTCVVPVKSNGQTLIFDIGIYRLDGVLCEMITGIQMRDVSAGRMKPPSWIRDIA